MLWTTGHEELAPWFTGASIFFFILSLISFFWPLIKKTLKKWLDISVASDGNQLHPDWTLGELFFHISPDVTNAVTKMWLHVGAEVLDKLSLGQLHSWGREMDKHRNRSPMKPIDKEYWHDAEFTYMFFTESQQNMEHARNKKTGIAYADIKVNKAQAIAIKWSEYLEQYVSMQMAAQDVYVRAKEKDHIWYHVANGRAKSDKTGLDRDDILLNCIANLIAGKIDLYGMTDLLTKRELIKEAKENNTAFKNKATTFRILLDEHKRVWVDLAVKLKDLAKVIEYIDNGLTSTDRI